METPWHEAENVDPDWRPARSIKPEVQAALRMLAGYGIRLHGDATFTRDGTCLRVTEILGNYIYNEEEQR